MKLLSMFRQRPDATAAAPIGDDELARARTRARRRLVGAIVLVTLGVVALPVMFDGEPRPLPPDIPIEIPRSDAAPPLVAPSARPAAPTAQAPAVAQADGVPSGTAAPRPPEPGPPEARPAEVRPAEPRPAEARPSDNRPAEPKPEAPKPAAPTSVESKPSEPKRTEPKAADARPAEPRSGDPKPAAAATPRFVVQVGAFADPASARDAVERVQKLGLKPFTQVVQTDAGPRTRVRLGPYASREEAQRVQARTEAAGIKSAVMPQ